MTITKKIALLFLGAIGLAYGTDCTISDTVRTPFGGYFAGRIVVALNSPASAQPLYSGSQTLTGWQTTIEVPSTANGVVSFSLVCTDTITPSGTSYSARYQPTSGSGWAETWTPATGTTTIRAMRSTTVPTPTTTFSAGQLALAAGSMVYGSSAGVGTALAAGSNGQVLALSGGYPAWTTNISGNAGTATALAANGTNCTAGTFPLGVDASGNSESCTALPTSITGTANQITASASTGAVTLSLPSTVNTSYFTANSPTGTGTTGLENLYRVRINMGTAPGYGLSIANGSIDPWFHVNSNGVGFVGDGTTIPFWSIEDQASFVRELRAHVVPSGSYSYLWAKSGDHATKPNDLFLEADNDVILQAGRSNSVTDNNRNVIIQATSGTFFNSFGVSGTASRTTIDQASGARFYQYNASSALKNLLQTNGFSYITGGRVGIGSSTDDTVNALQVTGSVSATGGFTGALTGNASTATALASTIASGAVMFGQGTGVPATDASYFSHDSTRHITSFGNYVRVMDGPNTSPLSGSSLELLMTSSMGFLLPYNRTAALRLPLTISTSYLLLEVAGAERARFAATSGNLLIGTTTDLGYGLHAGKSGTNGNLLVFDPTATVGTTKALFVAGQGQSGNLTEWRAYNSTPGSGTLRTYVSSAGYLYSPYFSTGSNFVAQENAAAVTLGNASYLSWVSIADATSGTRDTSLSRPAANTLQVGDGGANSNGTIIAKTHTWASGAEGTCNSTNRGQVVMVQGGAGVLDTFRICRKDAADVYAWTALY